MSHDIIGAYFKENDIDLKDLIKDEEKRAEISGTLELLQIVVFQVNEIFTSTIYNAENTEIIGIAEKSSIQLIEQFIKEYIKEISSSDKLPDLPNLDQFISWVKTIHINIGEQLFDKDFFTSVLLPAYDNITVAILDTIEEAGDDDENQETV